MHEYTKNLSALIGSGILGYVSLSYVYRNKQIEYKQNKGNDRFPNYPYILDKKENEYLERRSEGENKADRKERVRRS